MMKSASVTVIGVVFASFFDWTGFYVGIKWRRRLSASMLGHGQRRGSDLLRGSNANLAFH
ncbi:hypothetical protein BSN85_24980 [Bradyrhizobium brasilense]|uniref:hypothetical protein n=1 Tax=Bradyrhizobium brasilense TaxID=1419277 RepID=UPI00097B4593|nr:hypothetical protein [Bradyrhizobium brasilense]OMI05335.1 hypothetical protein BSN85_24980 [Bradyrhizobium brasilense]